MSFVYKNKSDQQQMVPGAGVWQAGEEKESPIKIENPNFEEVNSGGKTSVEQPLTSEKEDK